MSADVDVSCYKSKEHMSFEREKQYGCLNFLVHHMEVLHVSSKDPC